MTVKVRFAPSPTGYLHIGGARTALFNWLFARQTGGAFVLRIEDTDLRRSTPEMVEGILEGLRWLGLNWDDGPFFQSGRTDLYRDAAGQLLAQGKAYRCFCTLEELEERRQKSGAAGSGWQYDRRCLELETRELNRRLHEKIPFALRFRVPEGDIIHFKDHVFGSIQVHSSDIEDFVILRSDGIPTYHLSVVVDDSEMAISHVIRGADHLSNTSKQILLYRALQRPVPEFVHLPLILGTDKKRLSKRHGATSVIEYRKQGILPRALRNYLALLGWSPGTDQEIFTTEELVASFDLDRINKANAVFDPQKLEWMNGQYISSLPASELRDEVVSILKQQELWPAAGAGRDERWLLSLIELLKSRVRRVGDFAEFGRAFLLEEVEYDPEAVRKYCSFPDQTQQKQLLREGMEELKRRYRDLEPFTLETTEEVLRSVAAERNLKTGKFIGAVRVALTGQAVAPGIFDVITVLGRDTTVRRLKRLLETTL